MAHLGVFHTYFQQNNNNAAKEAIQKAISHMDRVNPKEKLYIQVWQARTENDLQKRNQYLEEIVEKYPRELEARYLLARRYENTDPEEAEKKYLEMLDMDPHYTWALARLIELARREQDYELALEYAKRYIALNPNEPNPYCKLGEIYLEMGELDQSIEQYRRALTIKRGFRKALDWIGYNYALKEDYLEAMKWADEFILTSSAPTEKANGYLTKAFIEYWAGSFQKAQKNTEMALIVGKDAQNPQIPFISHLLQGFIQLAQGTISTARNSFIEAEKMAIKAHPGGEMAYRANKEYFLGILDIKEGKLEQAQKRLSVIKGFSTEGYLPWVPDHVKRHEQALWSELLIAQGSLDEAISLLEPLPIYSITLQSVVSLTAGPVARANLIQLETRLAEAYERKGEIDKAIDVLKKLIPFDQTDSIWRLTPPKIYYDLGRLYEKKSLKEKAREKYTRFLELWKNADPGLPEVEDAKTKLAALEN
jgi:tetratricopeptide (TPR) repeat protein